MVKEKKRVDVSISEKWGWRRKMDRLEVVRGSMIDVI